MSPGRRGADEAASDSGEAMMIATASAGICAENGERPSCRRARSGRGRTAPGPRRARNISGARTLPYHCARVGPTSAPEHVFGGGDYRWNGAQIQSRPIIFGGEDFRVYPKGTRGPLPSKKRLRRTWLTAVAPSPGAACRLTARVRGRRCRVGRATAVRIATSASCRGSPPSSTSPPAPRRAAARQL
mgnify:CR=1 FL=1